MGVHHVKTTDRPRRVAWSKHGVLDDASPSESLKQELVNDILVGFRKTGIVQGIHASPNWYVCPCLAKPMIITGSSCRSPSQLPSTQSGSRTNSNKPSLFLLYLTQKLQLPLPTSHHATDEEPNFKDPHILPPTRPARQKMEMPIR